MREVLREGKTHSRVTFSEVTAHPHAFSVGALSELEGEITIFDGSVWIATTDGSTSVTSHPSAQYDSATLLTSAHVNEWAEFDLPSMPIEEAIEFAATAYSDVNTEAPFPFFIVGDASEFHLHVINGYCPIASPNIADEFKPWRLFVQYTTPITVLGFFAKGQEGVMTHNGSKVHMHGLLEIDGGISTGHLDSVDFETGAKLFLPAH